MKVRDIVHDYAQGRMTDEEAIYRLLFAYKAGEKHAFLEILAIMDGIAARCDPDYAFRALDVAGHA